MIWKSVEVQPQEFVYLFCLHKLQMVSPIKNHDAQNIPLYESSEHRMFTDVWTSIRLTTKSMPLPLSYSDTRFVSFLFRSLEIRAKKGKAKKNTRRRQHIEMKTYTQRQDKDGGKEKRRERRTE